MFIRTFIALAAALVLAVPAMAQKEMVSDDAAVTRGWALFERECVDCHTVGEGDTIGPDLAGVTDRRSREWLIRFIVDPDRVIAESDPIAMELLKKYDDVAMPNKALTTEEAEATLAYIQAAAGGAGLAGAGAPVVLPMPELLGPQSIILYVFIAITAVIVLVFGMVGSSTLSTAASVNVSKAYQIRRVLFFTIVPLLVVLLGVTLPQAPYAGADARADRIVYVAARDYEFVFSEESIMNQEDVARVRRIAKPVLAVGELVEFRVTSLDVTHGFGIYGPERQLLVQTQAMPGYVNRLLVRLERPGPYRVLCMEYCGKGHHIMNASFVVTNSD